MMRRKSWLTGTLCLLLASAFVCISAWAQNQQSASTGQPDQGVLQQLFVEGDFTNLLSENEWKTSGDPRQKILDDIQVCLRVGASTDCDSPKVSFLERSLAIVSWSGPPGQKVASIVFRRKDQVIFGSKWWRGLPASDLGFGRPAVMWGDFGRLLDPRQPVVDKDQLANLAGRFWAGDQEFPFRIVEVHPKFVLLLHGAPKDVQPPKVVLWRTDKEGDVVTGSPDAPQSEFEAEAGHSPLIADVQTIIEYGEKKDEKREERRKLTFIITGLYFGTESDAVKVNIKSLDGTQKEAKVRSVVSGTTIHAELEESASYIADAIEVSVKGQNSNSFSLGAGSGAGDGCFEGICVYRAVISPKNVSDIFGKRIAKNYIAIQVTITNRNRQFDYLVHDISIKCENGCGSFKGEASSQELSALRGVLEKGEGLDFRNVVLRVLRGAGIVAAGFVGLDVFGNSFGDGVAVFGNHVIPAYTEIFPDFSSNQRNRLNDLAYATNTLVPKEQARIAVAFLDQSEVLKNDEKEKFWSDPATFFATDKALDLRTIEILVDGMHIANVGDIPALLTRLVIDEEEMKKFQNDKPEVKGYMRGRFLTGAEAVLADDAPEGLSLELSGAEEDKRLGLVIKSDRPVAPGTNITVEVIKSDSVRQTSVRVRYIPDEPVLERLDPGTGAQGASIVVTLTGKNFIPGVTTVEVAGRGVKSEGKVQVVDGTTLKVKIVVSADAEAEPRNVRVRTPGGVSGPQTFTVEKKSEDDQTGKSNTKAG